MTLFTVQEFHDLVALLTQHPEWRAELRRLVLTEEILALPQVVRDLAEAQQRTEQQVAQLIQQVAQLTQQVTQLTEAQRRTERQIVRWQDDVGEIKGIVLEERYRNRAFAYFSRLVRRTHALMEDELVALLEEAVARGTLSEEGMDEIVRAMRVWQVLDGRVTAPNGHV
jgi:cell division protein FtsB